MSDDIGGPSLHNREPVALVMDVGGTWIRVALVTPGGDIVWRDRVPTKAHEDGQAIIERIETMLDAGISHVGGREIAGIGLGLASPVDPETGVMYSPPNIPGLDGVSFKSLWGNRVEWPILVGNDATLAALGEYRYGGGVGAHTLVYLTLSTGIGGGVVVNGRPLMGAHGMAGELGHISIDRQGPLCKCGSTGCLESLASGAAIADTARRRLSEGGGSMLRDMASAGLDSILAETVFEAAAQGDPLSREILEDVAHSLGVGLVNILHIFNPDVIVIGGGVSRNWDYLQPSVQSCIKDHTMTHIQKLGFRLEVSSFGDDVGLLGAAALVWQSLS